MIPLLMVTIMIGAEPEAESVFELIQKGSGLSTTEAAALEKTVEQQPNDVATRIQLLSYYASMPKGVDLVALRAARAKQIFWLIQHDSEASLGLATAHAGLYRLNCQGDELADPGSTREASRLWLEQMKQNPASGAIRRNTIDALEYCEPGDARQLLTESSDLSGLGRLYANEVLGVTGESYLSSDPTGSDPALRQSPAAKEARGLLEHATDKEMVSSAAITLLRRGATLWADGKLDWDYTPLGNALLAKAKQLEPNNMTLLTLPVALPARGERPAMTIRVGGNVAARNLIHKVVPRYPKEAREQRIQGTVRFEVLIGLDGKILHLRPASGPPELIDCSVDAVRQWEYKPTLLNGRPVYVVTVIDVNFTLSH